MRRPRSPDRDFVRLTNYVLETYICASRQQENPMDAHNLVSRAMAAYLRTGGAMQPGETDSSVVKHGGLDYVRLANVNGTLAVYRVRTVNGAHVLKGLKRWPAEIDGQATMSKVTVAKFAINALVPLVNARGELTPATDRSPEWRTLKLRKLDVTVVQGRVDQHDEDASEPNLLDIWDTGLKVKVLSVEWPIIRVRTFKRGPWVEELTDFAYTNSAKE